MVWLGRCVEVGVEIALDPCRSPGRRRRHARAVSQGSVGERPAYGPDVWILFVPITEEILFRGLILGDCEIADGPARAVVLSSVSFGLWHPKIVFWLSEYQLIHQMLYTTLIFGPVTAVLALKTHTIWPGAILHYLNNLPAAVG